MFRWGRKKVRIYLVSAWCGGAQVDVTVTTTGRRINLADIDAARQVIREQYMQTRPNSLRDPATVGVAVSFIYELEQ